VGAPLVPASGEKHLQLDRAVASGCCFHGIAGDRASSFAGVARSGRDGRRIPGKGEISGGVSEIHRLARGRFSIGAGSAASLRFRGFFLRDVFGGDDAGSFHRRPAHRSSMDDKEQDLHTCQILFVSRSEGKKYGRIFKALQGTSVLTVEETPDFLASGGAIALLMEADKLQFEVSMVAAADARINISANMLALARHVVTKTVAAKS
jgi:hypothetical protein